MDRKRPLPERPDPPTLRLFVFGVSQLNHGAACAATSTASTTTSTTSSTTARTMTTAGQLTGRCLISCDRQEVIVRDMGGGGGHEVRNDLYCSDVVRRHGAFGT